MSDQVRDQTQWKRVDEMVSTQTWLCEAEDKTWHEMLLKVDIWWDKTAAGDDGLLSFEYDVYMWIPKYRYKRTIFREDAPPKVFKATSILAADHYVEQVVWWPVYRNIERFVGAWPS